MLRILIKYSSFQSNSLLLLLALMLSSCWAYKLVKSFQTKSSRNKRGNVPLFLFLILSMRIQSQVNSKKEFDKNLFTSNELLFRNSHIGITIIPFVCSKAVITKSEDKYEIHSTPQFGFEAGLIKYFHIDTAHSIYTGIYFGAYGRNFNYYIPIEEFGSPPGWSDISTNKAASREFNFIAGVPLIFQKRWFTKNKYFGYIIAGATLRYTPYTEEIEEHHFFGTFFRMHFETNPEKKVWFTYNAGGGYSMVLKNKQILSAGVYINLSFTSFAKGHYQFTVPNKPIVEGDYSVKGSYIGLSLNYIFTRTNKLFKSRT